MLNSLTVKLTELGVDLTLTSHSVTIFRMHLFLQSIVKPKFSKLISGLVTFATTHIHWNALHKHGILTYRLV